MLTSAECLKVFGAPENENGMVVWDVPKDLEVGAVPNKIYINSFMILPLTRALTLIKEQGLGDQIKTWDGCFNIRKKRGGTTYSLHSWGVAIDINAAWNRMGAKPTMSKELVNCFLLAGFDWGGNWGTPDGMHFQLKSPLKKDYRNTLV